MRRFSYSWLECAYYLLLPYGSLAFLNFLCIKPNLGVHGLLADMWSIGVFAVGTAILLLLEKHVIGRLPVSIMVEDNKVFLKRFWLYREFCLEDISRVEPNFRPYGFTKVTVGTGLTSNYFYIVPSMISYADALGLLAAHLEDATEKGD